MTSALVLRNDADGVATLTLNRPDKLNALNPSVFVELRQHLDKIAEDRLVKCVVLTGSGRAFCAGHDLEAIANHERAPSKHFEPETVDALERLPQPTMRSCMDTVTRVASNLRSPAIFSLLMKPPGSATLTDNGGSCQFGGCLFACRNESVCQLQRS